MSVYLTAREAVGGDPDQLLAAADLLDDAAKRSDALTGDLHRAATSTEDFWTGLRRRLTATMLGGKQRQRPP